MEIPAGIRGSNALDSDARTESWIRLYAGVRSSANGTRQYNDRSQAYFQGHRITNCLIPLLL
jgi:hypothetical protein